MIPIRNIYYMLSYAFQVLNEQGYKSLATEEFHNTADLCAAILEKGISKQIKQGLGQEYILKTEATSTLRGKIDLSESIKSQTIIRNQLVCSYDEFSVNSKANRIIKSTIELLLRSKIEKERKKELRKLLVFFSEVDSINLYNINWNFQYNRNNQTYRMLISICYLVCKGLLQTQADGSIKLMDFFDEQLMCRLYEKFILEYYRKEFSELNANASQIHWQLDDGFGDMLPAMRSDIMLTPKNHLQNDNILIIDAKYYGSIMQKQYDSQTWRSNNLYQIFTYVKNKQYEIKDKNVSGMLLYAQTDENIMPKREYKYLMSGNEITVRTLDLNREFKEIADDLDSIANSYFMINK